jgi:hypothetical protein
MYVTKRGDVVQHEWARNNELTRSKEDVILWKAVADDTYTCNPQRVVEILLRATQKGQTDS